MTYDSITLRNLAMQFDWLRENGYHVVSLDDVLAAQRGERPLPPRAVLLTFDDGYRSFYTHVYPLLIAFNYPAVLSVVGSFLEVPPKDKSALARVWSPGKTSSSWAQLREMRRSGLVEIGSHTYGLHTTIFTNPQGGEVPAAIGQEFIRRRPGLDQRSGTASSCRSPRFGRRPFAPGLTFRPYLQARDRADPGCHRLCVRSWTGRYETDDKYRTRVRADLERNSELLAAQLGVRPRVIAWPFGRWNR